MRPTVRYLGEHLILAGLLVFGIAAGGSISGAYAQSGSGGSTAAAPASSSTPGQIGRPLDAFDSFLQSHPDVASKVRTNPSLLSNSTYMSQHPELQSFMSAHPGVARVAQNNPQRLMAADQRFRQSGYAVDREQMRGFDSFMKNHPDIAQQVSKDPKLLTSQKYISGHPELQQYMKSHPGVANDLQKHPGYFLQRSANFNQNHPGAASAGAPARAARP